MLVSTNNVSFSKARNTFMAEISELGPEFRFEQVFPDSCDLGVSLLSHKTNNVITFYIDQEVKDEEGDIMYWMLKPTNRGSQYSDMKFVIFND